MIFTTLFLTTDFPFQIKLKTKIEKLYKMRENLQTVILTEKTPILQNWKIIYKKRNVN